jgi:GT2 family glycosyltransferase
MLISVCVGSVRGTTLRYLVDSIMKQQHQGWELIIVAQGNDELLLTSLQKATERDSRIVSIHLQEFGRSRALNAAVRVAKGDVLAFTDDDCEAAPDWLTTIADCFSAQPDVGIVAGDLVPTPAKHFRISTCPAAHTSEVIYRPAELGFTAPLGFYWVGGNVAIRRSSLDRIGQFDNYLGVGTDFPSCEDVDIALRAEALNIAMWTTPRSIVYHTYGRRYGLQQALKHHRGYALGSGALLGKLGLWKHRLAKEWGQARTLANTLSQIIHHPSKGLLEFYKSTYVRQAQAQYLANFVLDSKQVSQPKISLEGSNDLLG